MSFSENPDPLAGAISAAYATADERAGFVRKCYLHICGGVFALIGVEAILLQVPFGPSLADLMLAAPYCWLVVIVLFVAVGHFGDYWAESAKTVPMQYAGLAFYIVAQAVVFMPLLLVVERIGPDRVLPQIGMIAAVMFGGLTSIVLVTAQSFILRRLLQLFGGLAGLLIIAWGASTSHPLAIPVVVAIIGLAGAYMLYTTSRVMYEFHLWQYTAASLALLASVALLLWDLLQFRLSRR
ncbi:MAG TPA: hypothetical protein VGY55_22895 [Pirellulales bacterium]|jgi:hypothetical protein|nr:hypothetical protein [Pirellulales bacterium]